MEIHKINEKDLEKLMDLYVQLSPVNEGLSEEKRDEVWEQIQKDDKITYLGAYEFYKSLGFDDTRKKAFNIRFE